PPPSARPPRSAIKDDGSPLRWPDLRVGREVALYRRSYTLLVADAFSRVFYAEQGQEQPPDRAFPEGPFDQRKALDASRSRAAAAPPARSGPAFTGHPPLPNDDADPANDDARRHSPRGANAVFRVCAVQRSAGAEARDTAVLRFYAAWDNTAVTFGEVLGFSLLYHVEDGTVEVREVHARNSGRDPFPLLLSRGRLPKTLPPVYGRPMSPRSRRLLALEYYDWRDLCLGASVNVYGRSLLLYDCDEATRLWLRQNVPGISEHQLRPIDVDFDPLGPKRPPMAIPPHTSGFGSEEDSLQNVLHLVPRPPPKPYADYLLNWNKVLRFEAAMAPLGPGRSLVGPHDAERRFIVNFHLLDCTLSVWEPKRKNSGMEQGTFLERTRVPHPATGLPYAETDMQ
ncbi:EF-hand domain-containing protein 1, partial [Tetrabaena socialis]